MSFPPHIWNQLKNLTADDLVSALEKDGWEQDVHKGAVLVFLKQPRRITVHYHPKKTYGPGLLRKLLADTGWTLDDMKRLNLIR